MSIRGGKRHNAGRKPDPNSVRSRRKARQQDRQQATVLQHPSVPAVPPKSLESEDDFEVPDDLSVDERNVWLKLAPLAVAKGTLTRDQEERFKLLCKNVIREKALAITSLGSGAHTKMISLVERALDAFLLGAYGRPIAQPRGQSQADDDDAFFGGANAGGR